MRKLKVCGSCKHAEVKESTIEPGEHYIFCQKHRWYLYNILYKPCDEFEWKPNA